MLATAALAIAAIGLWLESQEERPLGGFTGLAALALAVALLVTAVVLPTVSQVEFGFPVGMRIVAAARTREEDLHHAFLGQKGDLELYAHLMCDDADTAAELVEAAWADAARTWRGPPTPALRTYVLCILVQLMLAHSKWRPSAPTMSADSSPLSTLATEDRVVVVLRDFARLSRAQIAELMGMSAEEVSSRASRGVAATSGPPATGGATP